MNIQNIKKEKITDQVFNTMKSMILDGTWPVGEKIPSEAALAGLGAYRIGDGDEGDTSGPGTEWCTGHALATQATTLRSLGASGAALYRYAFLFANTLYPTLAEQEIAALREVWG